MESTDLIIVQDRVRSNTQDANLLIIKQKVWRRERDSNAFLVLRTGKLLIPLRARYAVLSAWKASLYKIVYGRSEIKKPSTDQVEGFQGSFLLSRLVEGRIVLL